MLRRVVLDARDKDAIYALEVVQRIALFSTSPDRVPSFAVLFHGEQERDVERDATGT